VREYADQIEIDEQAALATGVKEKAEEFVASGGEIYRIAGLRMTWIKTSLH